MGSEWRLEDLGGRGVLDRVQATLAFPEAGRVAGNSSCNRFFGSYTLMQDRIALGQLAGTRMACAPAVDEQETRYLDALQKAQRLEVRGTTMLMHVQGLEKPLRFVANQAAELLDCRRERPAADRLKSAPLSSTAGRGCSAPPGSRRA